MRAAQGDTAHADDLLVNFAGQDHVVEAWAVPIQNTAGNLTAIVTAFQDITARRTTEAELASYREHLEQRVQQRTAELAAVNTTLHARLAELSAINDISRDMTLIIDLELALQRVVTTLCELYGVQNASISLLDVERNELHVVAMEDRADTGLRRAYVGQRVPYRPGAGARFVAANPGVIADITQVTALPAHIRADLHERGVVQVLVAPLLARDVELGVIALVTNDPSHTFSNDDLRVAQTVAAQIAAALDVGRLLDEERRQRRMADALRETAAMINQSLDQETVLTTVLQQLRSVIDYEGAAISLIQGAELVIVGAEGLSLRHIGRRIPFDQATASLHVLHTAQSLMIHDTMHYRDWASWSETLMIRSWLGVPLVATGGQAIGVLNLESTRAGAFGQAQADLLQTFATHAAIAVTNARLYQQAQIAAAAGERERIARDLHDAVTQSIFSASLIAEALPRQLPEAPGAVVQNLAVLSMLTKGALAELRALLLELRPEHLIETPLDQLLGHLADAFTGRMGTPVRVNANRDPFYMPPPAVQITAYRIAQEALNNIAKHAQATNITLNLVARPGEVRLGVFDDGRGFDVYKASRERFGLSIMCARAAEIGAHFMIDSEPGMGTQLFFVWKDPA